MRKVHKKRQKDEDNHTYF